MKKNTIYTTIHSYYIQTNAYSKNRYILSIIIATLGLIVGNQQVAHSQQAVQWTQYMYNQTSFNPAYVGSKEGINLEGAFRAQWLGLEGRPLTQSIGVHLPIPLFRSGFGVNVVNDMLGAARNTSIYINYAYRLRLGTGSTLAIGLKAGVIQHNLNGSELRTPSGTYIDGGIDHNDNLIPINSDSYFTPDLGLGVHLTIGRGYAGVAVQHLLEPSSTLIQYKRHIFVNGGYDFFIGNNIVLSPSLLFKSDLQNHQADVGAWLTYDNTFKAGAAFRGLQPDSFDAVALMAGVHIGRQWMLTYSYDIGISDLRSFISGSHEIVIHYQLKNILPAKGGKTRYNPRFL